MYTIFMDHKKIPDKLFLEQLPLKWFVTTTWKIMIFTQLYQIYKNIRFKMPLKGHRKEQSHQNLLTFLKLHQKKSWNIKI
jgi:hypothetical protein